MRSVPMLLVPLLLPALVQASPVEVWVSDEAGGAVVLVEGDTGSVRARVAVGPRPRGLRLSRDGSRLFAATSGSPAVKPGTPRERIPPRDPAADGITVVDTRTHQKLRRAGAIQRPSISHPTAARSTSPTRMRTR